MMMTEERSTIDVLGVLVSAELKRAIEELALRDGRSTANYVRHLLAAHIKANDVESRLTYERKVTCNDE
jgi:hypothetical protein